MAVHVMAEGAVASQCILNLSNAVEVHVTTRLVVIIYMNESSGIDQGNT
jgi:hypothetical protein